MTHWLSQIQPGNLVGTLFIDEHKILVMKLGTFSSKFIINISKLPVEQLTYGGKEGH